MMIQYFPSTQTFNPKSLAHFRPIKSRATRDAPSAACRYDLNKSDPGLSHGRSAVVTNGRDPVMDVDTALRLTQLRPGIGNCKYYKRSGACDVYPRSRWYSTPAGDRWTKLQREAVLYTTTCRGYGCVYFASVFVTRQVFGVPWQYSASHHHFLSINIGPAESGCQRYETENCVTSPLAE